MFNFGECQPALIKNEYKRLIQELETFEREAEISDAIFFINHSLNDAGFHVISKSTNLGDLDEWNIILIGQEEDKDILEDEYNLKFSLNEFCAGLIAGFYQIGELVDGTPENTLLYPSVIGFVQWLNSIIQDITNQNEFIYYNALQYRDCTKRNSITNQAEQITYDFLLSEFLRPFVTRGSRLDYYTDFKLEFINFARNSGDKILTTFTDYLDNVYDPIYNPNYPAQAFMDCLIAAYVKYMKIRMPNTRSISENAQGSVDLDTGLIIVNTDDKDRKHKQMVLCHEVGHSISMEQISEEQGYHRVGFINLRKKVS